MALLLDLAKSRESMMEVPAFVLAESQLKARPESPWQGRVMKASVRRISAWCRNVWFLAVA